MRWRHKIGEALTPEQSAGEKRERPSIGDTVPLTLLRAEQLLSVAKSIGIND